MIDLNRTRQARIPLRVFSLLAFAGFLSMLNVDKILCLAGSDAIVGGATDGRVQAFDKRTGRTLWAPEYSSPFSSQPLLSGDRLYLGAEDGMLLAVDQKS